MNLKISSKFKQLSMTAVSCLMLIVFTGGISTASPQNNKVTADLAWTQSEEGQLVIYTSEKRNGKWDKPTRITGYGVHSLHPAIDGNGNHEKWLVWTELDNTIFKIGYAHHTRKGWGTNQTLETETENNIAPQILLSAQGIPLMVWAGNNNDDDDIYFSRFNGKKWSKPIMIHPDNEVPDILPVLDLTPNHTPRVIWQKFTGKKYEKFFSLYQNNHWTAPALYVENEQEEKTNLTTEAKSLIHEKEGITMPDFTKDAEAVYYRSYSNK